MRNYLLSRYTDKLMLQTLTVPVQSGKDCIRTGSGYTIAGRQLILSWNSLLFFSLVLIFQVIPVHAGDEEFNPSAYQIFDPVTGYFIDVEQPPDDQQAATRSGHAASTDSPGVQDPAIAASITPTQQNTDTSPDVESNTGTLMLAAGLLLVILAGVFAFIKRKGEHG